MLLSAATDTAGGEGREAQPFHEGCAAMCKGKAIAPPALHWSDWARGDNTNREWEAFGGRGLFTGDRAELDTRPCQGRHDHAPLPHGDGRRKRARCPRPSEPASLFAPERAVRCVEGAVRRRRRPR